MSKYTLREVLAAIDGHVEDELAGRIPVGYALQLPKSVTKKQFEIACVYYECAMQLRSNIVKHSKSDTIEEIIAKFESAPLLSLWVKE